MQNWQQTQNRHSPTYNYYGSNPICKIGNKLIGFGVFVATELSISMTARFTFMSKLWTLFGAKWSGKCIMLEWYAWFMSTGKPHVAAGLIANR